MGPLSADDLLRETGFSSYVLNAMYDATVAPGAIVPVTQQNLIPNLPALQQAPSGADLNAGGLTALGMLDAYDRQPTNFVMTAGAYLHWKNPDNTPPQYAGVTGGVMVAKVRPSSPMRVRISALGSPAQVTVLGSIVAHGGSITLSADSINFYASLKQGNWPAPYPAIRRTANRCGLARMPCSMSPGSR